MSDEGNRIVGLGSTVVITFDDGRAMTFAIVGTGEEDPSEGKISDQSPLGRALLGAKAGETRAYQVGEKTTTVTVKEVRTS